MKPGPLHTAAAVAGACGLVEVVFRPSGDLLRDPVLALCATLPLAVARRRPVPAAAIVTAAVLLALLGGSRPPVAALLVLPAVLFAVGLLAPARAALLFAAALVAYAAGPAATGGVTALGPLALGAPLPGARALGLLLLTTGAAALAAGARRRSRAETAARTAAAGAHAGTLHAYAERGERARIARELHDIVAHHISSISVQAETARLTVPGMPPDGAARLRAIGDTARQSLTEMRRLLGVLREDSGAAAPTPAPPQPGIDRLIALVDEAARATTGSGVRLIVRGPVRRLGPGVELTAYRVVQEALTNARRHAAGAPVEVDLRYTAETLHITVRDTGSCGPAGSFGPGPPQSAGDAMRVVSWFRRALGRSGGTAPVAAVVVPGSLPGAAGATAAATAGVSPTVLLGHGLLGMRERVAMAGGALRAGPGSAGGFVVSVALPIPPPMAEPSAPQPTADVVPTGAVTAGVGPGAVSAGVGSAGGAGSAGAGSGCGVAAGDARRAGR